MLRSLALLSFTIGTAACGGDPFLLADSTQGDAQVLQEIGPQPDAGAVSQNSRAEAGVEAEASAPPTDAREEAANSDAALDGSDAQRSPDSSIQDGTADGEEAAVVDAMTDVPESPDACTSASSGRSQCYNGAQSVIVNSPAQYCVFNESSSVASSIAIEPVPGSVQCAASHDCAHLLTIVGVTQICTPVGGAFLSCGVDSLTGSIAVACK